jgi:blocked-early-in-transport protein 1
LIHNGIQVSAHTHTQQAQLRANNRPRFHQRDTNRSSLFSGYDQRSRPTSTSPNPYTASNGYSIPSSSSNNTFAAYPGGGSSSTERDYAAGGAASFRTATPDKRGAYSDAVLSELESQNDEQVSEMSKKVGMLKDVSFWHPEDQEEEIRKLT